MSDACRSEAGLGTNFCRVPFVDGALVSKVVAIAAGSVEDGIGAAGQCIKIRLAVSPCSVCGNVACEIHLAAQDYGLIFGIRKRPGRRQQRFGFRWFWYPKACHQRDAAVQSVHAIFSGVQIC
ncbi:hypothetical protein D3C87_1049200 [compost metagenome]